jgi:hypothetical protein
MRNPLPGGLIASGHVFFKSFHFVICGTATDNPHVEAIEYVFTDFFA